MNIFTLEHLFWFMAGAVVELFTATAIEQIKIKFPPKV